MPRNFDESLVSEYFDSLGEDAKGIKIKVLLLGPNIKKRSSGARLRKYIASRCKGERNAIYGERKDLIETFQKEIGKWADLCTYELHLAHWVDAIILIPNSAGSLVELGMFSLAYAIHPKTLVLFSNKHNPQNKPDFMSLGPKKSYDNGRAFVEPVDYNDKELVWNIVDDFLSRRKTIKFGKNILRQ